MLNKDSILRDIVLSGKAISENNILIGKNISHIAGNSSGKLRIHSGIVKKFILITSQPRSLSSLSPLEIRCVLCKKVINYPCFYYEVKYAVNHFHYFVCFSSSEIVNTNCFK